jgi:hypothetical protein
LSRSTLLLRTQTRRVLARPSTQPPQHTLTAATKLRHAVSAERKLLSSQPNARPSLQSIMGAMQQRRSKCFIEKRFWKSVSVVDDWSDWRRRIRRSAAATKLLEGMRVATMSDIEWCRGDSQVQRPHADQSIQLGSLQATRTNLYDCRLRAFPRRLSTRESPPSPGSRMASINNRSRYVVAVDEEPALTLPSRSRK